MTMFKVLICGGRDYKDFDTGIELVKDLLVSLPNSPEKNEVVFITGCAKGADQIPILMYKGEEDEWGGLEKYPADWEKYGKYAGPIRNAKMLTEGKPDIVIAFPGGNGTAHMVKIAKKAGVRVFEFHQEDLSDN